MLASRGPWSADERRAQEKDCLPQRWGLRRPKRSGAWVMLVLGALVMVNLYVFVWDKKTGVRAIKQQAQKRTRTRAWRFPPRR